ncbi:hypothetical protein BDN72DRAFT_759654 [Pluteus cervinus]|uniref:Uncharacterized protein n=1 Tax=Pluteus cervinus TaxID=181527 RepID=A0ACD3B8F0_9AGAR|nr:hypothetical protein BDN72DRAFT_759654 [Pluteus cervinus]
MSNKPSGKFSIYRTALQAVSARTGAPLPSLIVSFGILHEITAIAPLVGIFYAARAFGLGERIITTITPTQRTRDATGEVDGTLPWYQDKLKGWVEEGEGWAYRVGRRYGIFGYEKRAPGEPSTALSDMEPGVLSKRVAGDVANAVVAYAATKALIPVRVGVSLYLTPAFSRGVIEPIRHLIVRTFRRQ